MDDISILSARDPDKKIVGLDITIYEGFVMDRLNSRDLMGGRETQNVKGPIVREYWTHHLFRGHAYCFDRKLTTTHVEQVFKIGTQ